MYTQLSRRGTSAFSNICWRLGLKITATLLFYSLLKMGEQLICKLNPMADVVKKQLGQLGDQWQSLNQVAASQTRSREGAKSLQDFNKKVEKLEAWIKDKVEKIPVF